MASMLTPEEYDPKKAEAEHAKAEKLKEQGYDPYFSPILDAGASEGSGTRGNLHPEHEIRQAKGDLPADPEKSGPAETIPFVMDD